MAVGEIAKVEDFMYVFLFPQEIAINCVFFFWVKIAFYVIFGLYKIVKVKRARFTILKPVTLMTFEQNALFPNLV